MIVFVLLLATSQIFASATSSSQQHIDLCPVKPVTPSPLVCSTMQTMFTRGVTVATEMNDGKKPTGLINVPYQEIATNGYLAYVKEHPEMIHDATPLIACVNDNPKVQALWAMVLATSGKALFARAHALSMYWDQTAVPLAQQQEKIIPDLRYAPHMVAIMVGNQELELDSAQQKGWNAIFAATASIMQAMEFHDRQAFCTLFENDAPGSRCSLL